MKKIIGLSFLILLTFNITYVQSNINLNTKTIDLPETLPDPNFEINFVLVFHDFQQELIDEQIISKNIITDLTGFSPSNLHQPYTFNVQFNYPDQIWQDNLKTYIDSISTTDWTSKLNSSALQEQVENFTRKKIFDQQNGTAIDARALENYLADNKPVTSLSNNHLYYLYVLNLSRLNVDGNQHWFNVTETDPDSGVDRFFWRLEWDYPLNYDVKFPYAGFSERTDIGYIDLTAFNWYLEWWTIWGNFTGPLSYYDTLDTLLEGAHPEQYQSIISEQLFHWINPWLKGNFLMPIFNVRPLQTSVESKILVVHDSIKPQEELEWIINIEFMNDELGMILQSTDVQTDVQYVLINDDPFLLDLTSEAQVDYEATFDIPPPFEDWKFFNGFDIWYEIRDNVELNTNYYSGMTADIKIRGLIYLLNNASYTTTGGQSIWSGNLYTGLGGGGIITILWELDRAFMPNGDEKSGISKILVHEIGHAIGMPHNFAFGHTADFISEVMGYYPGSANFSLLVTYSYWRNSIDLHLIDQVRDLYGNLYLNEADANILQTIHDSYLLALDYHNEHNYLESYNSLSQLLEAYKDMITTPPDTDETTSVTDETTTDPTEVPTTPIINVPEVSVLLSVIIYGIRRRKKRCLGKVLE